MGSVDVLIVSTEKKSLYFQVFCCFALKNVKLCIILLVNVLLPQAHKVLYNAATLNIAA